MKKKWVYKLKAIFTPSCWVRVDRTHRGFDAWLWDSLNSCEIKLLDEWTARINGKVVWVRNAPYSNGLLYIHGLFLLSCSRATAILLEEKIGKSYFH